MGGGQPVLEPASPHASVAAPWTSLVTMSYPVPSSCLCDHTPALGMCGLAFGQDEGASGAGTPRLGWMRLHPGLAICQAWAAFWATLCASRPRAPTSQLCNSNCCLSILPLPLASPAPHHTGLIPLAEPIGLCCTSRPPSSSATANSHGGSMVHVT